MSAPERIKVAPCHPYKEPDDLYVCHPRLQHPAAVEYIRADLVPQWQPIETAPRDGTRVLAYWPDEIGNMSATQVESWFGPRGLAWGGDACWQSAFEWGDESNSPTHWMPLPTPPEAD